MSSNQIFSSLHLAGQFFYGEPKTNIENSLRYRVGTPNTVEDRKG